MESVASCMLEVEVATSSDGLTLSNPERGEHHINNALVGWVLKFVLLDVLSKVLSYFSACHFSSRWLA